MTEKSPAFQWYPKDCDIDENVRAMDDREFGFYVRCLNHAWVNVGLPVDPIEIMRVVGRPKFYIAKVWPRVSKCFSPSEDGTRLLNPRQERDRAHMREVALERSQAGRIGNARRWQADRNCDIGPIGFPKENDTGTIRDLNSNSIFKQERSKPLESQHIQNINKPDRNCDKFAIAKRRSASATASATAKDTPLPPSEWTPDWDRIQAEYPGLIAPDLDCQRFISYVGNAENERLFFENLETWNSGDQFQKGRAFSLKNFLESGYWKTTPRAEPKRASTPGMSAAEYDRQCKERWAKEDAAKGASA